MPIYEYGCAGCGHEFEIIQGIKESPLTDCPVCQESSLQKKLSAAAFHLKGTGWYETDFKNAGKPADKSKKSEADSESKSESKAEKSDSDSSKTELAKKPASEKSGAASSAAAT